MISFAVVISDTAGLQQVLKLETYYYHCYCHTINLLIINLMLYLPFDYIQYILQLSISSLII
jgi:hypothetical protein